MDIDLARRGSLRLAPQDSVLGAACCAAGRLARCDSSADGSRIHWRKLRICSEGKIASLSSEGAQPHRPVRSEAKLNDLHGKVPESMTQSVRFAVHSEGIGGAAGQQPRVHSARQLRMELSDFLPHLGDCADDICLVAACTR